MGELAKRVADLERSHEQLSDELAIRRKDREGTINSNEWCLMRLRGLEGSIVEKLARAGYLANHDVIDADHSDENILFALDEALAVAAIKGIAKEERKQFTGDILQMLCEMDPYDCQSDPNNALCVSVDGIQNVVARAFEKFDEQE